LADIRECVQHRAELEEFAYSVVGDMFDSRRSAIGCFGLVGRRWQHRTTGSRRMSSDCVIATLFQFEERPAAGTQIGIFFCT
jgi:hypothetical protein